MTTYILRRVLLIIPTLFLLSILVFLSVRFIPGDIIDAMVANLEFTADAEIDREAVERMLGLDLPLHVQYARWIGGVVLHGSLGVSLRGEWKVEEKIIERLPVTFELGILALLIGVLIALPVGIYSAIRQETALDYVARTGAILGLATPNFWLGIMVMIFPVVWWRWSPPMEYVVFSEDPLGNLAVFLIPSAILGTSLSAETMRMTRTMMLEVLRQDYPHRLVQGAQGKSDCDPARLPQCDHPGRHPDWLAVADSGWWLGDHGEYFQPARNRDSGDPGPRNQRLPGGLRSQPVLVHRRFGEQSPGRYSLFVFKPQDPVLIVFVDVSFPRSPLIFIHKY